MESKLFEIGEIVLLCNISVLDRQHWNGTEVTIRAKHSYFCSEHGCQTYRVDGPPEYIADNDHMCAFNLRKRPQPPDWEKLAAPTDVSNYALT
jgi:hypothetical protein